MDWSNNNLHTELENIKEVILNNDVIKDTLDIMNGLGLHDCILGGGALRCAVWNDRHGFADDKFIKDLDILYHDPKNPNKYTMTIKVRGIPVEFKNQAFTHEWYFRKFGTKMEPLKTLEESVSTWTEVATCIAIDSHGTLITPFGVYDLVEGICRRNPNNARNKEDNSFFVDRVKKLKLEERYPQVEIII